MLTKYILSLTKTPWVLKVQGQSEAQLQAGVTKRFDIS